MTDKIKKLYCFIVENEGNEGLAAFHSKDGWMPMVAADMTRVDALIKHAQILANENNKKITLCVFSTRMKIKVISPQTIDASNDDH